MKRLRLLVLFFFFLPASRGFGQFYYVLDQSPAVFSENKLALPWSGGLNSAQYGTIDFDLDGNDDLVVFDRTSYKLSAFRKSGDHYEYSPGFEFLFPRDVQGWILFLDYDCDGKKDIFTHTLFGIKVYRNTADQTSLSWELVADPIYSAGSTGDVNLQVNITDVPGIADLDGDGDLDILVYNFATGGYIRHHKNMSMENSGRCGLEFVRASVQWGEFEECTCDIFAFDGNTCASIGGRVQHAGGKSMLLIDSDGDVDKELIMSQEDCNKLYFLENVGSPDEALMNSFDLNFPDEEKPAHMNLFPAAFFEDVTSDGLNDLLVSPNLSTDPSNTVDFKNSSWLYRNIGNATKPRFSFVTKSFLQGEMIDQGWMAAPVFGDLDKDGDQDLLVAANGFEVDETYYGSIALYENTGSADNPEFTKRSDDYLNLSSGKWFDIKPAFTDINRDGAPDLVFAVRTRSPLTSSIFYLLNENRPGLSPFTPENFQELNFRYSAGDNFFFYDIDRDGNTDILVGKPTGRIEYHRRSGSSFALEDNAFAGIVDNYLRRSPSLLIEDLDRDGRDEMAILDNSGTLRIVKNFTSSEPEERTAILTDPATDINDSTRFGLGSHLSVAHLFGDDLPGLSVGSAQGGMYLLRNSSTGEHGPGVRLKVWPNPAPASSTIYALVSTDALLEVYSLLGQKLFSQIVLKDDILSLDLSLTPGIYIMKATVSRRNAHAVKFAVMR